VSFKRSMTGSGLLLLVGVLASQLSEAGVSVVGGLTRERKVEAGTIYKGVVFVRNSADAPQEVKIYQTDYLFFCDGRTIYGEGGKTVRSNADWISFSPRRLTIPPKGTSGIHYSIKVPSDGSLSGTYWSMLMVEGIGKGSPEAVLPEEGKVKVGIRHVMRYGIQMVAHIGDSGSGKIEFLQTTKLLKENGRRVLRLDVENVGERWLRPFLWVELHDEEGRYIGRFEGERIRIFPGTSARARIDLSDLPEGAYKALVVADAGGDDVFGVTYRVKFEKTANVDQ